MSAVLNVRFESAVSFKWITEYREASDKVR